MTLADRELAAALTKRAGIDAAEATVWLGAYRSAPERAQQLLERWAETGEYPTEPLEGGHSIASLAQSLPPLEVFDLVDMLLREPRVGLRMIARAISEASGEVG